MSYIKNQVHFNLNTKFYIYIHCTPDGIPFYIGKGKENRCLDETYRNQWWKNIVNKYGYYVIIKEINLSEEDCFKKEVFWIEHFGRRDLNTGTLVNLTNGGEGVAGRIWSEDQKETRSKYFRENLETLQNIGARKEYFGKSLFGENNPNYGNKETNPNCIKVVKLDLKGNFICEYNSVAEASEMNNAKGIYQVCRGQRHQLKGYKYVYREDYLTGNYSITSGITSRKEVLKIDKETNEIVKEYNSAQETKIDGFSPNGVSRVCRGERKFYRGFKWQYRQDIV